MSNLNSQFDVLSGLPPNGRSALGSDFKQKTVPTATLQEGMIAAVEDESGTPVVDALTSATATPWSTSPAAPDYPWLVVEGMDQSDAAFADKVTVVAVKSGLVFKVETAISFSVGDLVYANAGVLAKVTGSQQAVGQVIEADAASNYIVVAV